MASRLQTPALRDENLEAQYYSAWHLAAIHICTSITRLQTVDSVAQELGLPIRLVDQTLKILAQWGLVRKEGRTWTHQSGNLHLPSESPFIGNHHEQWRQRAVMHSRMRNHQGLHYTQVQALDESALQSIKRMFLKCIDDSLEVADRAPSEHVAVVALDIFALSEGRY